MDRWRGRVAVVTGASSGIGEAIARELVKQGMVVVGAARRIERLEKIADDLAKGESPGKFLSRQVDVSVEAEVVELFAWVEERRLGGADVLVNNAGVLNYSGIEDGEVEQWRRILDVNLIGNMVCTRQFLRSLRRRDLQEGHIIVINSVASHVTSAEFPVYCASKQALRALTACLRHSLAGRGSSIKVTDICPGPTLTEIMEATAHPDRFQQINVLDASDVAHSVVSVLAASPRAQICDVIINPVPSSVAIY